MGEEDEQNWDARPIQIWPKVFGMKLIWENGKYST
jgi:hypothetical protein